MIRLTAIVLLAFATTASGEVETYLETPLKNPFGLTRGPDGALYVCDTGNHCIRRIAMDKRVTTVAGQQALVCFSKREIPPAARLLLTDIFELLISTAAI